MLKIFLVFYTASGGIASVSRPFSLDMEYCEGIAKERNEQNLRDAKSDANVYVAECEQHKTPPNVTVRIDPKMRKALEVSCIARGFPNQCSDLPNGDLEVMHSGRDKHGNRIHSITKPGGRVLFGTYDSKGRFHIIKDEDLEKGIY
ncbi:hypothetical protein JQ615_15815 [Bradyrhizobium jicamae]|uniref:Uncharacterized protein n=1 Tax=Bradyrhizobium jicamae TaxID=280332 RepID=A0ABS5FJB7_9BRAD|nr:hypothetical protein [Bradyrhizobium jicamae]MBR0796863.1 hypothetical protein [Bradyrhizobium jicamae]